MQGVTAQPMTFGPADDSGITFVDTAVMAPLVTAYQKRNFPGYRDHLPLIVGQMMSERLDGIQALNAYGDKKPAFMEFNHDRADPRALPEFMTQQMARLLGKERSSDDIAQLAGQAAWLVGAIATFDEVQFGPVRGTALRFEHGVVSHQSGLHATHEAYVLHRDAHGVPPAEGWREYLVRTSVPGYFVDNAQTKTVRGKITNSATLSAVGAKIWRAQAGAIHLVAAGSEGTFHGSHRPTVAEGKQPSLLLRMVQMP